jgi:pimeloyl-ACP methyl ester carboxylesterase
MPLANPRRPAWLVLLALLLAGLACNLPEPPEGSTAVPLTPFQPQPVVQVSPVASHAAPTPAQSPSTAPTAAYQPVFEPAACAFPIPPGADPACGYLVVPEDRRRPGGPQVRLHVAVFRSLSGAPAPDPVIYLSGGPGSSALELAGYMFRQGVGAVMAGRDLVFFDQRGTGYSRPRLDCPERQALAPVLLEGHLPPNESTQAILDAFRRCRERLAAEGVDLAAYTSAASAADLDDLCRALGYAAVNLYGVSYGTRLALTILRDHPAAVRSAVLDSTYPPQVNLYTALAPNAERSFDRLFEACAADPGCAASHPDLRAEFYGLVDELNVAPLPLELGASAGLRPVLLDGDLLIDVLFVGMYNPAVTGSMPAMIGAIRRGDTSRLRERLLLYFDDSTALGQQMSVQCAEEVPFAAPEDAALAAQGVQPQIAAFFPASVAPLFQACREWHPAPPDPRENQPVPGDTPTLILAGSLDPITPPDWGRLVAGERANAYFFEFSNHGHWVTRSSRCALALAIAFWDDPSRAPDGSCVGGQGGLEFVEE